MKLTHPETDLVVETDDEHAETYTSQGWAEAPTKRSRTEKPDES